ncbi:Predicted arabinose efflux permease, MFS family [Lentzea xinjiangensis]|uniref:Predicted arabinose efflux permease, MFS family n=1 Tax=Lentzea xinjiangensis TaxID=402600 RepID=A0A1H9M5L1_9PSEU|nr:MFS transporter [Lentzea xinjiangensis]SER19028.1 Predicted arabinose efflux permease, MFS family [Lentzea xinjiangensis]
MPRSLTPLLVAVLVMCSAQQLLTPVLSPLSQDLGLDATRLGLVLTLSSVAFALSSPLWGLALDLAGLRPVLIAGLGLCVLGFAGFAAAVTFGGDETLPTGLAFTFVLVCRSLLLGAGIAALLVAALAVAGIVPAGEGDRTRAVGLVGAAQGLAAVLGPVIGGALTVVSLVVPLHLATVIAVALAVGVLLVVRQPVAEHPQPPVQPWELLPAFGVGLLLHLSLGLAQVAAVSLVLHGLNTPVTTGSAGLVPAVAAIGLVVTQGVAVPLLRWPAARLMKIGAPIAVAGYAFLAGAPSLWLVALAFLVVAVGTGLAVTGFAAAASLGVGSRHQGLVAGLVNATVGVPLVVAPMLSGLLHDVEPLAPVVAAGVAAALAVGLSLVPVGVARIPQPAA